MKLGISLPLVDIQGDPIVVRDFAQAAEGLGYNGLSAPDHVLGVNVASRPDWGARNTSKDFFHDPFVLFGYLSACTRAVGFSTQVMILPQRQTALVAKQAASLDVLSGGRFRFGIGVGWNPVEFEALGEDIKNRGRRVEEQLEVMRLLWTRELVTYAGQWHRVPDAGINPLPVKRPIPIWMGGESPAVLRRAARLADGWITLQTFRPGPAAQQTVDGLLGQVREAGRDPAAFGIEGRVALASVPPDQREKEMVAWREMRGISHLCGNTMGLGLPRPEEHVRELERFKRDVLG